MGRDARLDPRLILALDSALKDISYALRRLLATPMFVSVIVITFACGIGANVAVFSIVNAALLRPLPFPNGSRLVQILSPGPQGLMIPSVSAAEVRALRADTHIFRAIALVNGTHHLTVMANGHAYAISGLYVTPGYLATLGIAPELGSRAVGGTDGHAHNVIISYEFWRKAFGKDPAVVGKVIQIFHKRYSVAGVLRRNQPLVEAESATLGPRDLLLPFPRAAFSTYRGISFKWGAIGLLDPHTTIPQANAAIANRLHLSVRSLHEASVGSVEPALLLVIVAVAAVLLLACVNVTNMLAARWSYREREFAVRRALGATRSRIAFQLLVETFVLACAGAIAGIASAFVLLRVLGQTVMAMFSSNPSPTLDSPTMLYALALVLVCTLLSAAFPILSLRSHDLRSALGASGAGGNIRHRTRLSSALVTFEIALAFALVSIASLFVTGFVNLVTSPLGVRTAGVVLTDYVVVPHSYRTTFAQVVLQKRLVAALRSLPGVRSAALSLVYPQSGFEMFSGAIVYGDERAGSRRPSSPVNCVTPAYFSTLGIPILAGRAFREGDTASSEPVAIVNVKFIQNFFHGKSPLGARIHVDTGLPGIRWARVVGVVGDERVSNLVPDGPMFYTPLSQTTAVLADVLFAEVYAPRVDPTTIGGEIHGAFAAVLPQVPPPDTFTFSERVTTDAASAKTMATLVTLLSVIALVLAVSGIFGVVAYSVTRRIHEFGVRLALGATTASILINVLRRTVAITAIGCSIGLPITIVAARILHGSLQNVSALDPVTAAYMVLLICAAALCAALLPALRAASVHPVECLRSE
jgi:predicted permease